MWRAGETWQMRCQQVHRAGAGVGTARASDKVCCQALAARGCACKSIAVAWDGQQSWQGRLQVITQPTDIGRAATGPSGKKKKNTTHADMLHREAMSFSAEWQYW